VTTLGELRNQVLPADGQPDTDALIKEARRRQRRRRRVVTTACAVAIGAVAAGLALGHGSGSRDAGGNHSHGQPSAPTAAPSHSASQHSRVALPSSSLFTQISLTPEGLLLTGVTRANGESPGSSPQSTCVSATLNPRTLAIGHTATASCGDPLLFGLTVEAVNTQLAHPDGLYNAVVSVNTADPETGQVTDGPVVMTYGSYSDTKPVFVYGSRWLWIYDVDSTDGPVLLQVSATSGHVVDTIAMPALYRPLLAADDGGVWVANSIGGSGGPALLYVAADAPAPRVVVSDTTLPVCWLDASDTSAWIGAGVAHACATQTVERFADEGSAPTFSVPGGSTPPPFEVIGSESDGLWTMQWSTPDREEIIFIDPDTGTTSVAATVRSVELPTYLTDQGLVDGQAVYLHGDLYLLEPPWRVGGYLGYSSVVRVAPSHRA
jgi:hypothetical protein